jgi:pre-mRNA-splicing helicase BRR2
MNKMATVIMETEDMDAMYRPKTKDTATAYEDILNFIRKSLGDQPQDILHGAAEETISLLKDDRFVGRQKQVEVEKVLTKMQPERFNALVQLGTRITDVSQEEDEHAGDDDDDGKIDDEMGVAVLIDEDEDEDELDEIKDSGDEDNMGGVDTDAKRGGVTVNMSDDEDPDDGLDKDAIPAAEIDAFWLQVRDPQRRWIATHDLVVSESAPQCHVTT